jgi:hypothetical protein
MAWAPHDTRRIENRGDALGDTLLIEGSRTNQIHDSRDLTQWLAMSAGSNTIANDGVSPDGLAAADHIVLTANNYSPYQSWPSPGGVMVSGSMYARRASGAGAGTLQFSLHDMSTPLAQMIDENWTRVSLSHRSSPSLPIYLVPGEGRALDGLAAMSLDYLVDLCQLEAGAFPSSPIETAASGGTRAADLLSYGLGQYPDVFRTSGVQVAFAPDFSSDDMIAEGNGTIHTIVSFGATDGLRLENRSGQLVATASAAGGAGGMTMSSGSLTWGRGELLTFDLRPTSLTVGGNAPVTPSTPLVWPIAPLYVGGADGSCFGRFVLTMRQL